MSGDVAREEEDAAREDLSRQVLEHHGKTPAMRSGADAQDVSVLATDSGAAAAVAGRLSPAPAALREEVLEREQSAPAVLNQVQASRLDVGAIEAPSGGLRRGNDEVVSAPAVAGAAAQTLDPGTNDNGGVFDERSPDGRFLRFPEVLGTGAYKTVYKGFDADNGIEVAWNKLHIERLTHQDTERVMNEVNILRTIQHPNIINLFAGWEVRDERGRVRGAHFITELMTSGTLKQYIAKVKTIRVKVIRKWCRNVLEAIHYLHSCSPPIMHRDLKCDNIFINGNVGEVKIGDLGLSSVKDRASKCGYTVIGTPEFMAPELYDENYSEKVDIYAFGMCMLEMVSTEYPYSECENAGQIFKKVLNGVLPEVLNRLAECPLKQVILQCLAPEATRPTALQLLHHPLFADWESDDGSLSNTDLMITTRSGRSGTSLDAPRSITLGPNGQRRSTSPSLTSNLSPSPSSTTVSRLSVEHAATRIPVPDAERIAGGETGAAGIEHTPWTTSTGGHVTVTYTYTSRVPRSASPKSAQLLSSWASHSDSSRVVAPEGTDKPGNQIVVEQSEQTAESARVPPRKRVFEGVDLDEASAPPTRPIVRVIRHADMRASGGNHAVLSLLSGPDSATAVGPDGVVQEEVQEADSNEMHQHLPGYAGLLVLSVRIPVSGAVKRITFAFDPIRESAEQVAREMVEELHLDESQIADISQAIQRQLEIHADGNAENEVPVSEQALAATMPSVPPVRVIEPPADFSEPKQEPEIQRDLAAIAPAGATAAPAAPLPISASSSSPPIETVPLLLPHSSLPVMPQHSGLETLGLDSAGFQGSTDATGITTTTTTMNASSPTAPVARSATCPTNTAGMSAVVVVVDPPPTDESADVATGPAPFPTTPSMDSVSTTAPAEGVTVLHRPLRSAGPELLHEPSEWTIQTSTRLRQPYSIDGDGSAMATSAQAMSRSISEPPQGMMPSGASTVALDSAAVIERNQKTVPIAERQVAALDQRASMHDVSSRNDLAGMMMSRGSRLPPVDNCLDTQATPLDAQALVQVMYGQTPALKRNTSPPP